MFQRLVFGFALALLLRPEAALGTSKVQPRLARVLTQTPPAAPIATWVFFTDKGPVQKATPDDVVTPRSLRRRAKVRPANALVDAADLPVCEAYVARIAALGVHIRQRSKWFNAVSVDATAGQIQALQARPEVRSMELLTRFRRAAPEMTPAPVPEKIAPRAGHGPRSSAAQPPTTHTFNYGNSLPQVALSNIPALHDRGINGQGVLVGHFDNGYRLLSHEALASLHVVGAHDFVDHDADPAPPVTAPDFFGAHGIGTLGTIAGFRPGQLIGPAFGADFLLARTENDASETPLEEDNWVAAMEWADSLGVEVTSTSLGYLTWDDAFSGQNLTWQDLNGNTAIMTRAADHAVALGIVVVTAAGNEGASTQGHNTLLVPADGDSVITAGGVWIPPGATESERYFTSSVGPTTSLPPRIKPDVAAQGAAVYIAGTGSTTAYGYSAGTSFACPLVAGVAAMLLSACPSATPLQIRDALRSTANHAANPDNQVGWGVVNATAALAALQTPVTPVSFSDLKKRFR